MMSETSSKIIYNDDNMKENFLFVLYQTLKQLHTENEYVLKPKLKSNQEPFNCIICTKIPDIPTQTGCCGKPMCDQCLIDYKNHFKAMHETLKCPSATCTAINMTEFIRFDNIMYGEISELEIDCVTDCGWSGLMPDLRGHIIEECTKAMVYCKCGTVVNMKEIKYHVQEECVFKKCVLCDLEMHKDDFVNHICDKSETQCPSGCGNLVQKWFQTTHSEWCLNRIVKCPLFDLCRCEVHVRDREKHFNACYKNKFPKSEYVVSRIERVSKMLTINFETIHTDGTSVIVEIFTNVDVQLQMTERTTDGMMGIGIHLMKCDDFQYFNEFRRQYSVTLILLNINRNFNHFKKLMIPVDDCDACKWKCEDFISKRHLGSNTHTNTNFIDNDNKMKFRLVIEKPIVY